MKFSRLFFNKKEAIYELNVKNEIFDWLCLIKGIFPFYSRKNFKKKKITYFSEKNIKTLKNDPILEKIKKIERWKKILSKTIDRNLARKKRFRFGLFPCYNFEPIIIERFQNFSLLLNTLNEILFFILYISNETKDQEYYKKKIKNDIFSLLEFFFQISLFSKIKYIFNSSKAFYLEIVLCGKHQIFTFPKKNFFRFKKFEKFKITYTFTELNSGLFNLICDKLKKINCFVSLIKNNNLFSKTISSKIFFRIKYYVLSKNKKKIAQHQILILKKKHKFLFKSMKASHLKKFPGKKKGWIFSKNTNFPSINSQIKGLVFYYEKNFNFSSFYFLHFSLLIKGYCSEYQQDKHTIFYFFIENYIKRSLISIYLKISWVFDSINCKNFLPTNPYSLKNQKIPNINPLFLKFRKKSKNQRKIFRVKMNKKKFRVYEKFCNSNLNFVFKFFKKKETIISKTQGYHKKTLVCIKYSSVFF